MDSSAFSEENRMSTALSLSALLLSVAAIFAYQWVTFAPWAGLGLLYRIKRVQLLVAAVAWTCALTAYALHPRQRTGGRPAAHSGADAPLRLQQRRAHPGGARPAAPCRGR